MDQFLNKKYKLSKSENFDAFLIAIGLGVVFRKIFNAVSPVIEMKRDGDVYTMIATVPLHTMTVSFKLGEEFEEKKLDGSIALNVITIEGNTLTQIQKHNGKTMMFVKEYSEKQFTEVCTVDDVVSTRVYTLVEK